MLQRTKGRILLALLVVTGMAGTSKNTTLSAGERKYCLGELKKSGSELISSLKKLSPGQLSFYSAGHNSSIQEHLYHLALTENLLHEKLRVAMKKPASLVERESVRYSDDQLLTLASSTGHSFFPDAALLSTTFTWPSPSLALESFKIIRAGQIRYIRNTTENLRNHIVRLGMGTIDCYQLLLIMFSHSNYHLQQIREIMSSAEFPHS